MSRAEVLVAGELATHARGKTIAAAFDAVDGRGLPRAGAAVAFAKEFQSDPDRAAEWLAWCATPGRVLLLVPPFGRHVCALPAPWEARRTEALAGGETELGRLLACERQHEVRGQLLPLERIAGQVVTAGWRKHPAAGFCVITTLPLWSLSALDHRDACKVWMTALLEQAGQPPREAVDPAPGGSRPLRTLGPEEWAVLLHLCSGPFESAALALDALARSAIHRVQRGAAEEAMRALVEMGMMEGGSLTARGTEFVLNGPYAAYARALRRPSG